MGRSGNGGRCMESRARWLVHGSGGRTKRACSKVSVGITTVIRLK